MRPAFQPAAWIAAAVLGALLLAWAGPRAFPLRPHDFQVREAEALGIAARTFEAFGVPADPRSLEVELQPQPAFERRLLAGSSPADRGALHARSPAKLTATWVVRERRPSLDGLRRNARIALDGEVLSFRVDFPGELAAGSIEESLAKELADRFLSARGFDLAAYGEPLVSWQATPTGGFLEVRFPSLEPLPVDGLSHGLNVYFQGERLAGFSHWVADARAARGVAAHGTQRAFLLPRIASIVLFFPLLLVLYPRRYEAGEVRLRRALQVALPVWVGGLVWAAPYLAEDWERTGSLGKGLLDGFTYLLIVSVLAFVAFLATAVGEAQVRERWPQKLAAFEGLLSGRWSNATVASSSLGGFAGGLAAAGLAVALYLPLQHLGAWPTLTDAFAGGLLFWIPGLAVPARFLALGLVQHLLLLLLVLPFLHRRLGPRLGPTAAVAAAVVLLPAPLIPTPLPAGLPWVLAVAAVPVVFFLACDLLTALVAAATLHGALYAYPLLTAGDGLLRMAGLGVMALAALPALATAPFLRSGRELSYRFDPLSDVPADVLERIAERERQRLELETGREIQNAILPAVPERPCGVEVAHAYLPASEVGGDFYDVRPLADGRLAAALGDVAGHGVSSGLVVSMLRGALAVHVRFDPRVEAVFESLNRLLHESASRRLLTTFCYLLIDPAERRLTFASAGHVVYLLRTDGRLETFEPDVYPLGVRPEVTVEIEHRSFEAGDVLFLASDGVAEAQGPAGEPFGFERLETFLRRGAGLSAADLRDAALAEVGRFATGQEDDRTLLVLRLP